MSVSVFIGLIAFPTYVIKFELEFRLKDQTCSAVARIVIFLL